MKKAILILILTLLVGLAAWAVQVEWLRSSAEAPPAPDRETPAAADRQLEVRALGRLEPADGVVEVAGTVGDRIAQLSVSEGDIVTSAKPLAVLESQSSRQFEIRLYEAQITEAKAKLDSEKSLASSRLASAQLAESQAADGGAVEIAAQQAQIEALRAAFFQAEKDQERYSRLAQSSPEIVSMQELELQELRLRKARVEVQAAEALLARLQQSAAFKKELAKNDRVAAESAMAHIETANPLQSLQNQLEFARYRWTQSTIVSPTNGTVLRVMMHPGETITQRPIVQVADLSRMICIAEVYDDQIQDVAVAQEVAIWSRAFGGTPEQDALQGRVRSKRRIVASPELRPLDPFAPSDRHVIEVLIELDAKNSQRASEFVHLQVDVVFKNRAPTNSDTHSP